MTNTEARAIFTKAAEAHRAAGDADKAANAELLREYFTNTSFRSFVHDETARINGV